MEGRSSSLQEVITQAQVEGEEGAVWTDEETIRMLDAIERHGEVLLPPLPFSFSLTLFLALSV
jgi:hypothetical protein